MTLIFAAILGDSVNYAIGKAIGAQVFQKKNSRIFKKEYLAVMGIGVILVISDRFPSCGFDPWPHLFSVGGWLETVFANANCYLAPEYSFAFVLPN